jgi:hypothetical protein
MLNVMNYLTNRDVINIIKYSDSSLEKRAKAGEQKGMCLRGRNFCPPACFGQCVGVRPPKTDAQVRSRRLDFVQSRFEFCPKYTATSDLLAP